MARPSETEECKCGLLARLAEDPRNPVEFDAQLNEYHSTLKGGGGYSLIYFCPFCGGRVPKSKRGGLFERIADAERQRLSDLTKELRTEQDVIKAFGEPDSRQTLTMSAITPGKVDVREASQRCPVMTYRNLSEVADVHVTVYPAGRVGIHCMEKPMLIQQAHQIHMPSSMNPPEPQPQIDTSRKYDIYCAESNWGIVVYRNARFKGAGSLLPSPGARVGYTEFVEVEQANGQSVFVSRGSIFRFCKPGTQPTAEKVTDNQTHSR